MLTLSVIVFLIVTAIIFFHGWDLEFWITYTKFHVAWTLLFMVIDLLLGRPEAFFC